MGQVNWKEFLVPYEYGVEELKVKFKNIRKELRTTNKYSPIEFVTGRVKKISSIIDKADRLGVELNEFELMEKIEDIAGIRIMCQFVEDIYSMVNHISKRSDVKVEYSKDYIKNFKESGYRSYHLIIRYPIQTAEEMKNILVEIQLRTLSMNFWATIEHSLKYKYDQDLPHHISERLKVASDAAFNLDEEMSHIKDEIISAQVLFEEKSKIVEDISILIALFASMGKKDMVYKYYKEFNFLNRRNDINGLQKLHKKIQEDLSKISKEETGAR